MDSKGTADISPMARFGVTEAYVANKLYTGLVELYALEKSMDNSGCVFLENERLKYLNESGNVDWNKIQCRYDELKKVKISLANKYFTPEIANKAKALPQ